ncbi:MAG: NAD(P)-dependent oxidoreductase, partial [Planctomycetota bacterium]
IQSAWPDANVVVSNQENIPKDILVADIFCGHSKVHFIDWKQVIDRGRLKWIQSSAAGLDHCLDHNVVESSITVSGCSALFANQVAEQTMALLYGGLRKLRLFELARTKREFVRLPTNELHGRKVGIIGFGGNGRRIAELLRPVVEQVWATDHFNDFKIPSYVHCLPSNQAECLFSNCDTIIVTLPLNSKTDQLVNSEMFSKLSDGSIFINVARGRVVNQFDLESAIHSGKIGFAGLDVVDPEPLPIDSPLWDHDNVLITPHVGAQSATRVPLTVELFCENIKRFREGNRLVNEVDKSLLFPHPRNRLTVEPSGNIIYPTDQ